MSKGRRGVVNDEVEAGRHPYGEPFETVGDLEHLAEREGIGGLRVAAELIEDELKGKSRTRRIAEIVGALVITAVIFARIIPKFLDVEYHDVWAHIADADILMLVSMTLFWCFTMWCYSGVMVHALPGLTRSQGIVTNFSGSALANVVPFGGAAGLGATYAQNLSWGFDVPSITLSIIVSGVWNVFAKLGMPIVVLALLGVLGHATKGLGFAAMVGFGVLLAAIVAFTLIFRSEGLAERVGGMAQGIVNGLRRVIRRPPRDGLADKVLDFRHQTMGLVRDHWRWLTLWMVAYKVSQGVLSLMAARAVGIEIGWLEIFAVYTFGELLSTIPLTPGGVGFVEAGSAGLLVSFGAPNEAALAAVLLYRTFTYLFEIPLGGIGWLTWAVRTSWRRPAGSRAQQATVAPTAAAPG
jgi:putative heme transporter